MRINSIFFVFLGLGILLGIPKSRRWIKQSIINNTFLRRNAIHIGMSIPLIRKWVVRQAMEGLN